MGPRDFHLFGPLKKNTWLASDVQQTPTRSKLSPPSYRHLTLIPSVLGYKSHCHARESAWMSLVTVEVWCVPSARVCHVHSSVPSATMCHVHSSVPSATICHVHSSVPSATMCHVHSSVPSATMCHVHSSVPSATMCHVHIRVFVTLVFYPCTLCLQLH